MAQKTSIQWTDATWNAVRGCSRISEGCRNCYAERTAARFSKPPVDYEGTFQPRAPFQGFAIMADSGPRWTGKVELIEDKLSEPLHWRKPRRIFVNSMSDLFHEALPDAAIVRVLQVIAACPQHTFQVLTKRAERMRDLMKPRCEQGLGNALANLWLGVSVEDQAAADERIPKLLETPAAVRFVSYEPALGPVDFTRLYGRVSIGGAYDLCVDALAGKYIAAWGARKSVPDKPLASRGAGQLDWLIVGGESGPGARPFDLRWARNAIAQCKAASVPCFVKQLGADPFIGVGDQDTAKLQPCQCDGPSFKDRKGGDWDEWPADLRVREFPSASPSLGPSSKASANKKKGQL